MSIVSVKRAIVRANKTAVALAPDIGAELELLGMSLARGGRVSCDELAFSSLCAEASRMSDEDRDQLAKVLAAPMLAPKKNGKKTAIVTFMGLVTYDVEYQPYAVSTRNFTAVMRALAKDDSIDEVVLMMDSPGGTVFGLPEAANAVYALRSKKPVHAVVDIMAASAGYYVASQATSISAMPSGAGVGSIGVRMMHVDCSQAMEKDGITVTHIYSGEHKVEGNAFQPLSDESRAYYQAECDRLYLEFLGAVARGRDVSIETVRENFGKGRMVQPADAKRLGMIDRLAEPGDAIAKLGLMTVAAATNSVVSEPEAASIEAPSEEPAAEEIAAPQTGEATGKTTYRAEVEWNVRIVPEDDSQDAASKEVVNEGLTTAANDTTADEPDASASIELMRARIDLLRY